MLLEINQLGEPVLRTQCRNVNYKEQDLDTLIDNMLETMDAAEGVGLAAPQIGIPINLIVIDIPADEDSVTEFTLNGEEVAMGDNMPLVMLNPEIIELSGKKVPFTEGCLSVLRFRADVHRPEKATVKFTTLEGKEVTIAANGLLSRALQHEIDHLKGILFIDRLSSAQKMTLKNKLAKLGLPVLPKKQHLKDPTY